MSPLPIDHAVPAALLAQSTSAGGSVVGWALVAIAVVIGIPMLIIAAIYLMVPLFRLIGAVLARIGRFVASTLGDIVRGIGTFFTAFVLAIFTVFNVLLGRWSAAQHYGRAVSAELVALGACAYRLVVGNPARLVFLEGLVEGLERRVPAVMANAPGATAYPRSPLAAAAQQLNAAARELNGGAAVGTPRVPAGVGDHVTLPMSVPAANRKARAGQFTGYQIVGTLPGGGSGSRLYIARPDEIRRAAFARDGHGAVGDVVIKSFMVSEGSSLPSIIRENRALDAARKLGLVLDHELSSDRFYYVMRYVPGDSLSLAAQRLHAQSPAAGLGTYELERAVSYVVDLVATLDQYHRAGLWHKDIKPDNIIVTPEPPKGDGRAHLVDFGLLTPLRGTMTLTTHGTEYFRDPEMVRMAMRGVKVHEVDGAKFDVYGAGAVLYSIMENSFPANGGMSVISRSCPETIKWIVRRAMTEYDKRYNSSAAMLADLQVVMNACRAGTINALRVADLPSMHEVPVAAAQAATPPGPVVASFGGGPIPAMAAAAAMGAAGAAVGGVPGRRSAREQLESARARVAARRERAQGSRRMPSAPKSAMFERGASMGVFAAVGLVVVVLVVGGIALIPGGGAAAVSVTVTEPSPRVIMAGLPGMDETAAPKPAASPGNSGSSGRSNGRITKPATPKPPMVKADGAPLLLLREPAVLSEPLAAQATRQVAALKDRGFVLLGEAEDTRAWSDDISAQLRKAVGLVPLGSKEALAAVQAWLATEHFGAGPDPAMIVWIKRDDDAPDKTWTWVIPSPRAAKDAIDAAAGALKP